MEIRICDDLVALDNKGQEPQKFCYHSATML
jgi:hypothetical protein